RSCAGSCLSLAAAAASLAAVVSVIGIVRGFCLGAVAIHVTARRVVLGGDVTGLLDRHDEADASRGKHLPPVPDQLLVGPADVADLAVQVEQAERIDVTVLLAKRRVPID